MKNLVYQFFFLTVVTLSAGFLISPAHKPAVAADEKKNILFIAVDDLRPMLGCYGEQDMHTPNIDELARGGTLFNRAYCNVPVCGASRASLLTGLRPSRTRFLVYNTRADKDAPGITSLPAYFKQNGYNTTSLGKVFHFSDDMKDSWTSPPWSPTAVLPNGTIAGARHYLLPHNQLLETKAGRRGYAYEKAVVADSAYFDGQVTERAAMLLKNFSKNATPFFLAVGFQKPHLPFNAPERYWNLYDPQKIRLPSNNYWPKGAPKKEWYGTGELRNYEGVPLEGPVPDTLAVKLQHAYKACISYVDALIGKLMQTLRETGLDKNTIVVLWGDHGYLLGEHQLWCKHITFNKALNAPLIIKTPDYKGNNRVHNLAEYIDIYPTMCDLAGLPFPQHLEGRSLTNVMNDPSTPTKEYVLCRYVNMEAIKTDRYLLTQWIDSSGKITGYMMYDHKTDPEENRNIAGDKKYSAVMKALSKKLNERMQ